MSCRPLLVSVLVAAAAATLVVGGEARAGRIPGIPAFGGGGGGAMAGLNNAVASAKGAAAGAMGAAKGAMNAARGAMSGLPTGFAGVRGPGQGKEGGKGFRVPEIGTPEWTEMWHPVEVGLNFAKLYGGDLPAAKRARMLKQMDEVARKIDPSDGVDLLRQHFVRDSELPNKKVLMAPENIAKNPFLLLRANAGAVKKAPPPHVEKKKPPPPHHTPEPAIREVQSTVV